MNKNGNKMNMAKFSGIPLTLSYKNMDGTVRLWIQKILSGDKLSKNYIFAKTSMDNTILFYTKEGILFDRVEFECRLPAEMFSDKLLVGVINSDRKNKNSELINLTVDLVAHPKEDDIMYSELAKFREEMIQKFG